MNNECKEIEKLIPAFLEDDLTNAQLKRFLDHVEHCADCKEELTIQELVRTGTKRLEDGQAFHLGEVLEDDMTLARGRLQKRQRLERTAFVLQAAVFIGLFLLGGLLLLLY